LSDAIAAMPRADLHVHLEGTISPETLWAMASRNQVALPVGSLAELRVNHERFGFGGRRALDLVTRRLEDAERGGGPVVRLILDIPSESVAESGPYTAALLEEEANPAVVAIGLGGPEERCNLNGLRYGLADVGLRRRLLREFEAAGRSLGLPAPPAA
jgi:hypothetical protein